jgi:hypothetical protein
MPSITEVPVSAQSRQFIWEFDTGLEWSAYGDSVTQRLAEQLRVRTRDNSSITLSGIRDGDAYYLELQGTRAGLRSTHVRATLRTTPD